MATLLALLTAQPLFGHGDLDARILALTGQLRQRPADASLYLTRGDLHREHRDWDAALGDYARALEIDASRDEARLGRARVLIETRDHRAARADLDAFITRHPRHALARVLRARCLARLGDDREAAGDYDRALSVESNPDWFVERADLLRYSKAFGPEAALASLNEATAVLGPIVTLELIAVDLEVQRGSASLDQAAFFGPRYAGAGRLDEKLDSSGASSGSQDVQLRRYDAALDRLERLSAQSIRQEQWLVRRGEVLERAHRWEAARRAYVDALTAIEDLPAARRQTRMVGELTKTIERALARIDSERRGSK